jgi:signal transduction histidine kinase
MELLIREVVQRLQLSNKEHKLIFSNLETKHQDFTVLGDREWLEQVMINLINNAIKYSGENKKVMVTLKKEGRSLRASVQDFGIGIPKNEQAKIFAPFYQAKSPAGTKRSGLGLGLFLARKIIRDHRGKLSVESKKDKGSTFYFTLPIRKK